LDNCPLGSMRSMRNETRALFGPLGMAGGNLGGRIIEAESPPAPETRRLPISFPIPALAPVAAHYQWLIWTYAQCTSVGADAEIRVRQESASAVRPPSATTPAGRSSDPRQQRVPTPDLLFRQPVIERVTAPLLISRILTTIGVDGICSPEM
jgi:hypothetical protein